MNFRRILIWNVRKEDLPSSEQEPGSNLSQVQSVKLNVTPKYGFDFESWLDLLNLELWVHQSKHVENNNNDITDPDLDVEMEKEDSE